VRVLSKKQEKRKDIGRKESRKKCNLRSKRGRNERGEEREQRKHKEVKINY
jgi:hypothetical protein